MQLTQQHLYLLTGMGSAVITAMLVYILMLVRQRRAQAAQQLLDQSAQQQRHDLENALQQQRTELALEQQAHQQATETLKALRSDHHELQEARLTLTQQLQQAQGELRELRSLDQQQRRHHEEKLQQLEMSREQLKKDFSALAQEVLKSSQQEFNQHSREGLDNLLKPFREQIHDFRGKVENLHQDEIKQREALKTELKHLQQLNQQMTTEAHELSTALRGQKKMQGNWGELVLENVLDRSGLRQDKDYKREVSFNTETGRRRPDVVVYLPEEKHLVIDSKVSLNAYTRYVNAEDEIERAQALKEHVQALTARIQELADKSYFDLPGIKSPEMVFMFIPIESAFVEAMRSDEQLFQQAIEKQVLVATPTTLLTSLNIVRQLWRFEDQNRHAARLADSAAGIYNKLDGVLDSLAKLGNQLDSARKSYDTAMNRFVSGKGNLVKRVEDFQQLGVAVQKEMSPELLEKARLELDLIEHQGDSGES